MVISTVIYTLGSVTALTISYRALNHIYTYFLRPSSLSRYLPAKRGSADSDDITWALITGASDGIGRGFAEELCSRGFNVILHGRNATKLETVKAALNHDFPASKVKIVTFDVTSSPGITADTMEDFVRQQLKGLRINVLINNIGGMYKNFTSSSTIYGEVKDYSFSGIESVIDLNVRFGVHLTRLLLPTLEQNSPSLVLNISSAASLGLAYLAPYSGSKGFVQSFTSALKAEFLLANKNVDAIGIIVGNVRSNGNKVDLNFFTPTSRTMAKAALDRVGCGKAVVIGYWPHWLQLLSADFLPESTMRGAMNDTMVELKKIDAASQKLD
jgi:17beta-estradiol 17-dehydrogenase / very-long-chain 3-oxoacyl-CoA reductase